MLILPPDIFKAVRKHIAYLDDHHNGLCWTMGLCWKDMEARREFGPRPDKAVRLFSTEPGVPRIGRHQGDE